MAYRGHGHGRGSYGGSVGYAKQELFVPFPEFGIYSLEFVTCVMNLFCLRLKGCMSAY